jgi:hypothetical protein
MSNEPQQTIETKLGSVDTRLESVDTRIESADSRIIDLLKGIKDLESRSEFGINLTDCFLKYPIFICAESGKLITKYRLPIRAYAPQMWSKPTREDGKFLREIHIKIGSVYVERYPRHSARYDIRQVNDILRCCISGYRKPYRISYIGTDESDGVEYFYFQLYVSSKEECQRLTNEIVRKWLRIVFKPFPDELCSVIY